MEDSEIFSSEKGSRFDSKIELNVWLRKRSRRFAVECSPIRHDETQHRPPMYGTEELNLSLNQATTTYTYESQNTRHDTWF